MVLLAQSHSPALLEPCQTRHWSGVGDPVDLLGLLESDGEIHGVQVMDAGALSVVEHYLWSGCSDDRAHVAHTHRGKQRYHGHVYRTHDSLHDRYGVAGGDRNRQQPWLTQP